MASERPVIFWWITPSIHMEPCMREFAALWPAATLAVWCAPLSVKRRELGWRLPELGAMPQVGLPTDDDSAKEAIERIVAGHPGAIHVYSGWRDNRRSYAAFKAAQRDAEAKHVVVAEQFRGWGIRRYARHARAMLKTLPYRRHIDALLGMGEAGVSFYRELGFRAQIVFPFIYQSPSRQALPFVANSTSLRFVYVGSFDARKGLQDLLRALGSLRDERWTLTIIGDGRGRHELEQLGRSLGLDGKLHWKGVLQHDDLVAQLPNFDVAVVPSRFDGWGVVTNEAIEAGLAVVVSDRASSKDLVRYSGAGSIFRAGDPDALANCLRVAINEPDQVRGMKRRAAHYRDRIGGYQVARYLADVLTAVSTPVHGARPSAPWVVSVGC